MPISVTECLDAQEWNRFVASVPYAHFQQSWEWGDLAHEAGGRAVRLWATRDGDPVAAAQVFIHGVWRTGWTHLYVPRGPAVPHPSIEVLGPLFDRIRLLGHESGALGIRVDPNVPAGCPDWEHALRDLGLHATFPPSQPRSSWLLDIDIPEAELLANMKQKTRYNIKLAARKGVEIHEGGAADVAAFHALLVETAQRDDFFAQDLPFYQSLFRRFWASGRFRLLLARFEGELMAAATFLHFGGTCWYVHGASSNAHRNLMAPHLLQWEGIRWAVSEGCTIYDFRAVPDILREDQDMFGVYRFKEGFGGRHFTTLETYVGSMKPGLFDLWQLHFKGRFALDAWKRRRAGLPARQFA